jgi:hypothetical protein
LSLQPFFLAKHAKEKHGKGAKRLAPGLPPAPPPSRLVSNNLCALGEKNQSLALLQLKIQLHVAHTHAVAARPHGAVLFTCV